MNLKISKVRYTSKNGITIDFDRPGTIHLTPEQAYAIYLSSNAELTQNELNQHFSKPEQLVLIKYQELLFEKMMNPNPAYEQRGKKNSLQAEITRIVDLWLECSAEGKRALIEKYLGWKLPNGYKLQDHWLGLDQDDDDFLGG
jgi:hypothetical protein